MRVLRLLLCGAAVASIALPVSAKERGPQKRGPHYRPPHNVVIFALPGITWSDIRDANVPHIRAAMRGIAALSARTAARQPNINRGYLTLGAGNPAYAPTDDPSNELAFEWNDSYENGTAAQALARRTGRAASGAIVDLAVTALQPLQRSRNYGAQVGSLGEALRRAGVRRGVVSAADIALSPTTTELRRGAVLALMDERGTVDQGELDGLLRPDPHAPFGVVTDANAFARAAQRTLAHSNVAVFDPGETVRADEYVQFVAKPQIRAMRRAALRRADDILGRVQQLLGPKDVLYVVAPSGPTSATFEEHLAPIAASGLGFERATWLRSTTTRHDGMVVLSDVAPTILDLFGIDAPNAMVGTPIRAGSSRRGGVSDLVTLDLASGVRERFASAAFWVIAIVISILAILAFIVFLDPRTRFHRPLVALAYFGLAVFPAAHIIRAFHYWWLGATGAHFALYALAALIALAAWRLPGPRWGGAIALMLLAAALFASDVVMGGPLQINGIFGHSPLVAGRFYGVSNPGYAVMFSATLLGLTGLAELRGQNKLPSWCVAALIALVVVDGLPSMGADFGGLLAGVPAVAVTIALGRRWRIRARTIVGFVAAAVMAAIGLSFVDLLRPAESRTHLGRFASELSSGDFGGIVTQVHRKGANALLSLTVTRWTWFIPVAFAVLFLLLIRPRGVLRDVLQRRPILVAGLWGTLVAGALGFAVNDSGISIPALALAFVVPFFVLLAVDTVQPRKPPAVPP